MRGFCCPGGLDKKEPHEILLDLVHSEVCFLCTDNVLVGGVSRTLGNVTGAAGRGVGDTITGATGSAGKPVGDAIGSIGTGVESGASGVAKGVENAGQWKK